LTFVSIYAGASGAWDAVDRKASLCLPALDGALIAFKVRGDGFPGVQTSICFSAILLIRIVGCVHSPRCSRSLTANVALRFGTRGRKMLNELSGTRDHSMFLNVDRDTIGSDFCSF